MTKTIELKTKTIKVADEPDRTKKYKASEDSWLSGRQTLEYDEDRAGWTWGTKVAVYKWEQLIERYSSFFPLTLIEPEITVEPGNWSRTDTDGDSFELSLGYYGGPHRVYVSTSTGRSNVAYLTKKQLVELRDYLNRAITVEEV